MSWWSKHVTDPISDWWDETTGQNVSSSSNTMSYDQAHKQAVDMLSGDYKNSKANISNRIDRNNVSRGFFGQAPGDYMKNNTLTQMDNDYNSNVANLATALQNNTYNNALSLYQMQLDDYNAGQSGLGGLTGQLSSSILKDVDWSQIFGG